MMKTACLSFLRMLFVRGHVKKNIVIAGTVGTYGGPQQNSKSGMFARLVDLNYRWWNDIFKIQAQHGIRQKYHFQAPVRKSIHCGLCFVQQWWYCNIIRQIYVFAGRYCRFPGNTMKRSDLEKKAIQMMEKEGYRCERAYSKAVFVPGKGYIARSFDFFHVVDIIAIQSGVRFIQVTSENANPESKHHSASGSDSLYTHQKKIEEYWEFDIPIELWLFRKLSGRWNLSIWLYQRPAWIHQEKVK